LQSAGIEANQVDYLNLHGTATRQNDAMESRAVNEVFGPVVPVSSSKGLTGHTLGAAGALEAAFCWLLLSATNAANLLPVNLMEGETDVDFPPLNLIVQPAVFERRKENWMMSNSFAFGGSNIALLLKGGH
jgi:3-oxoacyl-[acyl-carrier-protein] synthase-1